MRCLCSAIGNILVVAWNEALVAIRTVGLLPMSRHDIHYTTIWSKLESVGQQQVKPESMHCTRVVYILLCLLGLKVCGFLKT